MKEDQSVKILKMIHKYIFILFLILLPGCVQPPVPKPESMHLKEKVSSEPHPEALKHFMDAQLHISQNNYSMAILELQDALKLDPTAGSIHVSMAESYWKLGKIVRAEEHLNSAIQLDPNDVEARKMLVEHYIMRHQFDDAEKQLLELQRIEPENAIHIISLAELAAAQMQWVQSITLLEKAYEIEPSMIFELEKAAEIALRSNNIQMAKKVYEKLVKIDERNIEYLSAFADLIIMENQYDEAARIIEKIMDVEGVSKERLFQSGIIFYQKRQFQTSLNYFTKANDLDGNDLDVIHFIATVYLEMDNPIKAQEYALNLQELDSSDSRGYISHALSELNQENYGKAITVLSAVADRFKKEYAIQYLLGNAHYQKTEYEKALIYLNRALKLSPKSRNVIHVMAIINDSMKQWSQSDSLYERLISSDSSDAQAYNNYAYSLVERDEKLDLALKYSQRAIDIAPNNAAYLDTYGWILFKLGKNNEALNYIRNSIELENTNAVVLEHLGDVLLRINQNEDALEYYRKALKFDSNNERLKQKAYPQ